MPVFYASPSRVVIYSDGDTSPETASPPNLSRVKFDTDLDYVRIVRQRTVTVSLSALDNQSSGNQDPAVLNNRVLETHGLGYTPLVFGYTTISGVHVPLRGSVPIQISSGLNAWCRCISLGASSTSVILNEYAVRQYSGAATTVYPAISLNVTYFITEEAL